MTTQLSIMERDNEVLRTLTRWIRVASLPQLAKFWWSASVTREIAARKRLRELERCGLLRHKIVQTIAFPPLTDPLIQWQPGELIPEFGPLAWLLKRRWQCARQLTAVYFATAHAARRFGGRRQGRIPRAFQVSHDLGVAEMHFAIRRKSPDCVALWIDEDRLAPFRRGEKLPDAVLATSPDAIPRRVLEFGGAYGKQRLQNFHDDCEGRGLPYEIW